VRLIGYVRLEGKLVRRSERNPWHPCWKR